ncbi:hypothetical protein SK128_006782 [Halocaridina rubra]|uniref:Peptidase A2 domain-containing protein n=1 Tax=Halocaridina rubra TaxID=373956 RepID=A0AAN8ZYG6_HALRR
MASVPTVAIRVTGPGPLDAQARTCNATICNKTGHYNRCFKKKDKSQDSSLAFLSPHKKHSIYSHMSSGSTNRSPQPISVHLLHDDRTSRIQMLPNTGADVTIIGFCHLKVHMGIQAPLVSFGHCQELAIISPDFPKPILAITHINRCTELSLPAITSPSAARDFFFHEFIDVLVAKADLQPAPLKKMICHPMKIHLDDDTVPVCQSPLPFRVR